MQKKFLGFQHPLVLFQRTVGGLSPPWDLDPPCLSPSKISVSPPFEIFNLIPPLRKKFIP